MQNQRQRVSGNNETIAMFRPGLFYCHFKKDPSKLTSYSTESITKHFYKSGQILCSVSCSNRKYQMSLILCFFYLSRRVVIQSNSQVIIKQSNVIVQFWFVILKWDMTLLFFQPSSPRSTNDISQSNAILIGQIGAAKRQSETRSVNNMSMFQESVGHYIL